MPGLDDTYVVDAEEQIDKKLEQYVSKSDFEVHSEEYDYNLIRNKPEFATVATSGKYGDLIERPNLAPIATTGDFADLENVPSISDQMTKEDYEIFDQELAIPRDTNDLTNGAGFISQLPIASPTVLGAVKIGVGLRMINDTINVTGEAISSTNMDWMNIANKPTKLSDFESDDAFKNQFAPIAYSGDYYDLSNVPQGSAEQAGIVKIDGDTIQVNANGALEAHAKADIQIKSWTEEE